MTPLGLNLISEDLTPVGLTIAGVGVLGATTLHKGGPTPYLIGTVMAAVGVSKLLSK